MTPDIANPSGLKKCDIVMKGGVTSGIIYPGVVSKLAERYQFESIGGTSAGAIAAALTAAAEFARRTGAIGGRDPFGEVAKIPGFLAADSAAGGGSNLFRLFQPQPRLRGLFKFLTAFLLKGWAHRLLVWFSVLWFDILLGVLPGAALAYLASAATGWRLTAALALGLFVAVTGSVITAVVGVILRFAKLPIHYYGLCTGYTPPLESQPPSLVAWLYERLNAITNIPLDRPLTFGDLCEAGITLRMITTSLTFGRPFTLPFRSAEFYYSPSEFRLFFPREVVGLFY